MKNTIFGQIMAFSLLGVSSSLAAPVDFTTGFTVDSALNGQNGWLANGGLTVRANGINDNGFDHGLLSDQPQTGATGTTLTASINFTYSVVADAASGSPMLNVAFHNSNDPSTSTGADRAIHNRLGATVVRNGGSGGGLRVRLYQNWGSISPTEDGVENKFAQSGVTGGSTLGLDRDGADEMSVDGDEDLDSDQLQLTLSLTAGFDEDDWSARAILRNVTTDTILLTHTRSKLSFEALGEDVWAGIGFGQGDGNASVTDRAISSFDYTVEPTDATVDFLTTEGIADGDLNNSVDWSSTNGNTVDTTNSVVNTGGFLSSIYQPLAGFYVPDAEYKSCITFSFTDNATFEAGNAAGTISPAFKPLINAAIYNQPNGFNTSTGITISIADLVSNEVVVTTANEHGLETGDTINMVGLDFFDTDPNGIFTVTVVDGFNFTYPLVGPDEFFGIVGGTSLSTLETPQLRAGLKRAGDGYTLHLQTSWSDFAQLGAALASVAGVEQTQGQLTIGNTSALSAGIDRSLETPDLESDTLQICLTMIAGATSDSWTAKLELINVTTGTTLISGEIADLTSFEATRLYGGFGSGQGDGNAAVANRDIDLFEYTVTYPSDVIPADIVINSVTFDGTNIVVGFNATASTGYKLQSSLDLATAFADTGETLTTDGSGSGTFSYAVPTPTATRNFFRVSSN